MSKIITRMGDGSPVELTEAELRKDLEDGAYDAADRGGVPSLNEEDYKYLEELFKRKDRFVGVDMGNEIVLTYDEGTLKLKRHSLLEDRLQALTFYERFFGADTLELCHVDYSYKPLKPIMSYEEGSLEMGLLETHCPLLYGAMPNLGLYTQPDGPCPNPMELLPQGKIKEARASYEEIVKESVKDIVFASAAMHTSGADGINFDTVGASGDPDFYASLLAAAELKKQFPEIAIEMGMAGEFVLGTHGDLYFEGTKLAGLYPHKQVVMAEKAGVTIFGPVVNTNTDKTIPWNLARTVVFVRACVKASNIPIHANMGMGVGAVPVNDYPPVDCLSRASKALVELCDLDGL
jgi:dimethylamine--corrinoid protein Co-methyltransferase